MMNSSSENVAASNEIKEDSKISPGSTVSSLSSHDGITMIDRIKNNCNNLVTFMLTSFALIDSSSFISIYIKINNY